MKNLHRNLLIAATVGSLGLTTAAFAGHWGSGHGYGPMGGGDCPMMRDGGRHRGQKMAMMRQFHDERMELLAARLKLKPEQDAAWQNFLAAQDTQHDTMLKIRQQRRGDRGKNTGVLAHLEQREQRLEQKLTMMKARLQAAKDLYTALDPTQKKVMDNFFANRPGTRMMRHRKAQPNTATPSENADQ